METRRCLVGCLLFLAGLLFCLGIAGVGGATQNTAGADPGEPQMALIQEDIDADSVTMSAQVEADGDADWELQYRLRLDDDEQRQAFEELEADIESDPESYLGSFRDRITETVRTAEESTAREMSADEFAVSTRTESQPQAEFGIVVFSFEWSGFAAAEDGEIRAGDAIDQLFLEADQRLRIGWPDGYQLESSTPEPTVTEQQRVVWRGPLDFDAGQPRVVLVPEDDGFPLAFAALAGGLVLALVASGYWWSRRHSQSGPTPAASEPETTAEPDSDEPAEQSAGTASADMADSESQQPPPELLSNEEQLLQLLQQNGGRMKQKAVAEELDWSAAKTSQVVGDLRDAEKVESFRLGRENILTLPDVDVVDDNKEPE